MKQLSCLALAVLWWTGSSFAATAPIYINTGTIQAPPQIDAAAFLNEGNFSVASGSLLPYETQNTLNFTNRGIMFGSPGFRLLHINNNGYRFPAANIINEAGALIDSTFYVWLEATNVVNHGVLESSSSGLIRLKAKSANLSRSGLALGSTFACGGEVMPAPSFIPDENIFDEYWAVGTDTMRLDRPIPSFRVPFAISPFHNITNLNGFGRTVVQVAPANAFVHTNALDPTNWIIQVVFVQPSTTNLNVDVRFAQGAIGSPFLSAAIQWTTEETNVVDNSILTRSLYFVDRSASETNFALSTNVTYSTFRPAPFLLTRCTPNEWFTGVQTNSGFDPAMIYDSTTFGTSNAVVGFNYAAYGATVVGTAFNTQPGGTTTNSPGRIEIEAQSLNLERTRIRSQQYTSIKTDHLISSSNAVISSPRVSYDLASTNGFLQVKKLTLPTVGTLQGGIFAWSGIWTNYLTFTTTNDPGMTNEMIITNTVVIAYHVLLVDSPLSTSIATVTSDIQARATHIVLGDDLNIEDKFVVNAEKLTISGTINLLRASAGLGATNFPSLAHFTNFGTINVPSTANFGFDRPTPLSSFVNTGAISAVSVLVRADEFENSGSIETSVGLIALEIDSGRLEGGAFSSGTPAVRGGDIQFNARNLKFRNYTISSGGTLRLNVTDSLFDSGAGAKNRFQLRSGFNLPGKPARGDLLGTTLLSEAPDFAAVNHTWAGENRGATRAGYSNNVAIGRLILRANKDSLLVFSGAGGNNGLYVDFLELEPSVETNLLNTIQIDPSLTIYFAAANVSAEKLDGQFNGRLKWISEFAGPNSSIDVLLADGRTITVNRALRNSLTIDSDGDGVANGFDFYPFDAAVWNSVVIGAVAGTRSVSLTWVATPRMVYHVESTTNLAAPNWQPVLNYTHLAVTNGVVTMTDTNISPGEIQRFYRVRYNP